MNDTHHPPAEDAVPPELATTLARLRNDLSEQHPPPMLWRRVAAAGAAPLRAAVPRAAAARPAIAWPAWAGGAVAALAALLLVWSVSPGRAPGPRPPATALELGTASESAGPVGRVPRASGFVPVASPERFAELWQGGAQAAPAWVVRTELPRERLAALGLPYDPARAGEPVHAELLMHPSGDVLAVRLLR